MSYLISAHFGDQVIKTFLLMKIELPSGNVFWTNSDIPLVTGAPARADCAPASTWTVKPFRVDGVSAFQGNQSGAQIQIGNADNVMSAALFFSTNPMGVPIHVWEAWFDPTVGMHAIPDDSTQILEARIDTLTINNGSDATAIATIVLAPSVDFTSKIFPRRMITQKCQLDFKGNACQSTGTDTTCDRTITSCSLPTKRAGSPANGNRDNFGGFAMLPAITV
jgi:phage-related protein